jgi:hypothetical protein
MIGQMSIGQIVILCAIVAAFSVFAAVLAWGERQTRNFRQARTVRSHAGMASLKTAAAKAEVPARSSEPAKG